MIGSHAGKRSMSWIPWIFVGFFLVVFAANGTMLFFALDSWTGLTTDNAYQQGLSYNERIAERDRQAALGWQVTFEAAPTAPGRLEFDVQVADDRGLPVTASAVAVSLTRPTHEGYDVSASLRPIGPGHYVGVVDLPLPGQWQAELLIEETRGPYRQGARFIVP